jgi:hypothetical protein
LMTFYWWNTSLKRAILKQTDKGRITVRGRFNKTLWSFRSRPIGHETLFPGVRRIPRLPANGSTRRLVKSPVSTLKSVQGQRNLLRVREISFARSSLFLVSHKNWIC